MSKKIIFIPEIFNPKFYQYFWRKEAKKLGIEFIEFEKPFYSYWSIKNMKRMVKDGIKLFEQNKNDELYVVCHSFGGILVNCILQKVKNNNIKKIFILASPLKMNYGGLKKRKKILNYNSNFVYKSEILTYGAYFDPVVLKSKTKYSSEIHKNIFGEHMTLLYSKKIIRDILN